MEKRKRCSLLLLRLLRRKRLLLLLSRRQSAHDLYAWGGKYRCISKVGRRAGYLERQLTCRHNLIILNLFISHLFAKIMIDVTPFAPLMSDKKSWQISYNRIIFPFRPLRHHRRQQYQLIKVSPILSYKRDEVGKSYSP